MKNLTDRGGLVIAITLALVSCWTARAQTRSGSTPHGSLAGTMIDLGKNWPTEKHFTAWLGLALGSRQSGKRRGSQKRGRNRAAV